MTLPEIAEELRLLSASLGEPRLADLADEIRRRPARRVAPITSTRMSPSLARAIRVFCSRNPTMSQVAVARHFNVNPGRVSEALRGKRH